MPLLVKVTLIVIIYIACLVGVCALGAAGKDRHE